VEIDNNFLEEMNRDELVPMVHQNPILNKITNYYNYEDNQAGKLILPCGYGKMYISLFYLKQSNWNDVVIIVPSLILLEQYIDIAKKILTDWTIVNFDSNTKIVPNVNKRLIITTYNSAHLVPSNPNFVVYDEAHHTCVVSHDENSLFRNTLNLFKNAYKLFMTATEKIISYNDDDQIKVVHSMDNEIYGDYIEKKDFDEAIEERIISDYNIVIPEEDTDPLNIIVSAFNELPIHHLLVYSNTCEKSKDIHKKLKQNNIHSFYLDGDVSKTERNRILKEFQYSTYGVLCSVRVLQEGISMPIVDSCYFSEKRTSEIDITQMIGRTLRFYPGKDLATVILPGLMADNKQFLSTIVRFDKRLNDTSKIKISSITGNGIKNYNKSSTIKKKYEECLKFIKFLNLGRCGMWDYKYNLCLKYEISNPNKNIARRLIFNDIKIG